MKIAIRVDASSAMGTGHLRRSLALAAALRAHGGDVVFVTRDLGLDPRAMIAEAGFEKVEELPAPDAATFSADPAIAHSAWGAVSQRIDADETVTALAPDTPDWVVIDSYAFGADWHRAVREGLGCAVAAIDDLADRAMACDLVIDHNPARSHRAKYADVAPDIRVLGGPRFALLGPAFASAPRYAFSEEVAAVGVFMGGVDAGGHSLAALDAIERAGFAGPVEVVSTSANPRLSDLRERVHARPLTTLSVDLPDLTAFFARHDLQIGAGGGASWERCCIGAPTLLVVLAANQEAVAPRLAEDGVVALAADPSVQAIAEALGPLLANSHLRRGLADKSRALVDGRGAERVALALLAQSLTLRKARPEDARAMFDWRDHPATRAASRTQVPLEWEAHRNWLDRTLADPQRLLFVAEIGGRAVGVIRFDIEPAPRAHPSAEVSLYCDPDLLGLGLGSRLLAAGESALAARLSEGTITATVREDNAASQRLFSASGYERIGATRFQKSMASAQPLPAARHRD
ncbi:MAG: UDP-2,4-diacetamido-2,4,6-trideoxy-beta-L-altropyranose hydrolase [Erythrobacter sp.]|uniref:UDP-2,4-diacetamido-2,4, 6-trideoxy-beta-L-altropyranose hydrolase n=1 Tax=Erythrobacter sp. TaxID=1042 RepID=UPI00260EAA48|nr:UDP-2,4-diacetamido-2,4,6-trideoxy-beta-L-altropyranose hydrolase [Erythrobacter sp.]MDJ0978397.1 UDP-2,4-diacetamido-2,4,6-trideoxy-beta-L-altropyranose hydrolase [Erythrobacter sp.]